MVFLICLLLLNFSAQKAPQSYLPKSAFFLEREGYSLSFDGRTKNAFWVYERLTNESLSKNRKRKGLNFKEDEDLPFSIRAHKTDYQGAQYDRGHLCPFADVRNLTSFYLSNICPQRPSFNRGVWHRLEQHVRKLVNKYDVVHVVTMPLYLAKQEGERRFVCYEVIGEGDVAVPTHFCKVIFAESKTKVDVFAYLLPHSEIPKSAPLEQFQTNLETIEKLSGVVFTARAEN